MFYFIYLARTETLTFRLSKRLRSLAEIAARDKGIKLAAYVEGCLEAGLHEPIELLSGSSIAICADKLYDEEGTACFLKRLSFPWSLSPEQKRLLDLIRTSPVLYPSWGSYNGALIRQYWTELWAVAEGMDDARALPAAMFADADVEFALMSEAERIALYQKNPGECARRTEQYMRQTRREETPSV